MLRPYKRFSLLPEKDQAHAKKNTLEKELVGTRFKAVPRVHQHFTTHSFCARTPSHQPATALCKLTGKQSETALFKSRGSTSAILEPHMFICSKKVFYVCFLIVGGRNYMGNLAEQLEHPLLRPQNVASKPGETHCRTVMLERTNTHRSWVSVFAYFPWLNHGGFGRKSNVYTNTDIE